MATKGESMHKSFDQPDERLVRGGVTIDVLHLGDLKVKRQTYPPGWRFSTHMGAPQCLDTHVGYVLSGRIRVAADGGSEYDIQGGDAVMIPAGHDAWVVGDDPCVFVQFDEGESAAHRFGVETRETQAA